MMVEIHGEFNETYSVVTLDGYLVPHLKVRIKGDEVFFSLDDRFGITVKNTNDIDQWIYLIANAMAIAAGYTCFGEGAKLTNPYQRKLIGLSMVEFEDLKHRE